MQETKHQPEMYSAQYRLCMQPVGCDQTGPSSSTRALRSEWLLSHNIQDMSWQGRARMYHWTDNKALCSRCWLQGCDQRLCWEPYAFSSRKTFFNSPLSCMPIRISLPPTNSPLMYTCGIVGHSENFLTPSRMSGSVNTFRLLYSTPGQKQRAVVRNVQKNELQRLWQSSNVSSSRPCTTIKAYHLYAVLYVLWMTL